MLNVIYSGDDSVSEYDIVFDTGASGESFIVIDKRLIYAFLLNFKLHLAANFSAIYFK